MAIMTSDMSTDVHSTPFVNSSVKGYPIVISNACPSIRILVIVVNIINIPRLMRHMVLNDFIDSTFIYWRQTPSERESGLFDFDHYLLPFFRLFFAFNLRVYSVPSRASGVISLFVQVAQSVAITENTAVTPASISAEVNGIGEIPKTTNVSLSSAKISTTSLIPFFLSIF